MATDNEQIDIEALKTAIESLDFTSEKDLEFLTKLNEVVESATEVAKAVNQSQA